MEMMMSLMRSVCTIFACSFLIYCADTTGVDPTGSSANDTFETATDPGKADEGSAGSVQLMRWANTWDRWTTEALDQCGYNDSSLVGTFDPSSFDPSTVMAEIRGADGECEGGRIYSHSRENAVELFIEHTETDPMTSVCLTEDVSQYSHDRAYDIIGDPANLGVFASLFPDGAGDAEVCAFYHFYIFRPDGTLLRWTFSYVD